MDVTDRYDAMGIPHPDPKTMCKGACEGTGVYPMFIPVRQPHEHEATLVSRDYSDQERNAWRAAHKKCNFIDRFVDRVRHMEWWYWKSLFEKCDGWHFIKCEVCKGTGLQGGNI